MQIPEEERFQQAARKFILEFRTKFQLPAIFLYKVSVSLNGSSVFTLP